MRTKTRNIIIIIFICGLSVAGWLMLKHKPSAKNKDKIIHPHLGNIQTTVSTTGTVLPKNRLEIKPPVNGRIEEVLVKEGQMVNAGDIVVWMSSTDRAALLDAARGQSEETEKYWKEVYKPIPLIAPIEGQVIVGTVQPGQTVTTSEAVIVLSDRLIVRAQVDETDIGGIKQNQDALVSLDAYTDVHIQGTVDHIYYESKTVNNVTIYEVDLTLEKIPDFFRSGMNTNIDFILERKRDVLVLPVNAVQKEQGESYVMVVSGQNPNGERRKVVTGIADEKNIEIASGLSEDDDVILRTKKYVLPQNSGGSSPFMPARRN